MFGASTEIAPRLAGRAVPFDPLQVAMGLGFIAFSVITLYKVSTIAPDPRRAAIRPALITVLDFTFVSCLAINGLRNDQEYRPEMMAAACAVLIAFSLSRSRWWHPVLSLGCALISMIAVSAYGGALHATSTPFVAAGFVALGILVVLASRASRAMFRELRRRDALTRFLPRQVAERMLAVGPEALAPVSREVTVLFSDIRGFTALSEALAPREVLELLDVYFGHMTQIVKGHDGVVGKFLGDGLLAFWNAPDRDPDHAAKAVRAAVDMQRVLVELNAARVADGAAPLKIGIGVHTGPVAAGMLGGLEQAEYTIIGDAVNVASRIEGLTKTLGADILVIEPTWVLLADRIPGHRLAAEEIRGRKEPVVLYAIDVTR
jgi:adenylate cyclase